MGRFDEMYPTGKNGRTLIASLIEQVRKRPAISVFTGAELVSKAGSFGNYQVGIRIGGSTPETLSVEVGSIEEHERAQLFAGISDAAVG